MQQGITSDSLADTRGSTNFLGLISAELGQHFTIEAMVAIRDGAVDMTDIQRAIETALSMPGADYTQLARTDGMRFIVDDQSELDFLPLGFAGKRLSVRLQLLRLPCVLWESALQAVQTQP